MSGHECAGRRSLHALLLQGLSLSVNRRQRGNQSSTARFVFALLLASFALFLCLCLSLLFSLSFFGLIVSVSVSRSASLSFFLPSSVAPSVLVSPLAALSLPVFSGLHLPVLCFFVPLFPSLSPQTLLAALAPCKAKTSARSSNNLPWGVQPCSPEPRFGAGARPRFKVRNPAQIAVSPQ